jgi:hypothetical protein
MSNKKNIILTILLSVALTGSIVFFISRAGTLYPSGTAPVNSQVTLEDIYCKITGCTPASYNLDSPATATGTMRTLQEIYDAADYHALQKAIVYDDYNCANNNQEASSTCAGADPEYTGEEGVWSSSTDSILSGALVASGKVYKDLRTGLYWADAYDGTSGQGSPNTRTNSFTIGTGCSNTTINNGTCAQDNYQTKGQAIQYCLDLALDATGDGTNETDWYLPSQKELMQAYLDGAGNNLPNADYFYWSSTEFYSIASIAWNAYLSYGYTYYYSKTGGYYARCVRR